MSILGSVKELKYHYPTLWDIVESLNGSILGKAYSIRLNKVKELILSYAIGQNFALKYANLHDSKDIVVFLKSLSEAERAFFNPFPFTLRSINHVVSCGTYQVYLVRNNQNNELIGLFFLRFFLNRQCFLGFVVKNEYRGRGIGKKMIDAMVSGVQGSGFTLLSTVCAENKASLHAHLAGGQFEIIETLPTNEIVLKMKEHL